MKRKITTYIIVLFALFSTNFVNAQELKFGFSVGSGLFAIEEHNDNNLNMSFSAPFSFSSSISVIDKKSNSFGIKMQYADSRVKGNNWLTNEEIDGLVSLSSLFGYYEKFWVKRKFSHSFIFGFGFTNENYLMQLEEVPKIRNYASLLLGYGLNYSISDRLNIRAEVTPTVTDIFNGIRYFLSDWQGQSVGEDVHLFINIGIEYKINLSKNVKSNIESMEK